MLTVDIDMMHSNFYLGSHYKYLLLHYQVSCLLYCADAQTIARQLFHVSYLPIAQAVFEVCVYKILLLGLPGITAGHRAGGGLVGGVGHPLPFPLL